MQNLLLGNRKLFKLCSIDVYIKIKYFLYDKDTVQLFLKGT